MLWQKSKALSCRPSELLGLVGHSYEAYCLDEAVVFFGMSLEQMLDEAGHKASKEERKVKAARERLMKKIFDPEEKQGTGFADPAAMFG